MKIKANNTEDFEKQYYNQFNGEHQINISIELHTVDSFWEELIETPFKNTVASLQFSNDVVKDNITALSLKTVFHPKYGNITWSNKNKGL